MTGIDLDAIRLRPIALADWPRVHEWAGTEQACRYQAWGPNTPEQTREFAAAAVAAWAEPGPVRRTWVAVIESDGVVGIGELRHEPADTTAMIGYGVHNEHWGRGIGSTIARLLRDFGFEALGVHRVQATCDPRNVGSARILRAIGMTLEGTLRENLPLRDGWRDSHVFGILEPEWRALAPGRLAGRVQLPG